MSLNKKLIWGGLGWVVAGPIGAILGYAYGSMNSETNIGQVSSSHQSGYANKTKHGDFVSCLEVCYIGGHRTWW